MPISPLDSSSPPDNGSALNFRWQTFPPHLQSNKVCIEVVIVDDLYWFSIAFIAV